MTPDAPPPTARLTAPRSRADDLDTLADAVIGNLQDGGDQFFGLSGRAPFGRPFVVWDVLDIIGLPPDGVPGDPNVFGDGQIDYGEELWCDVLGHIAGRWAGWREGEGRP